MQLTTEQSLNARWTSTIGGLLHVIFLTIPVVAVAANVAYQYDPLNRLTRATYPGGAVIAYAYDAGGNLLTQTVVAPDVYGPLVSISAPADGTVTGAESIGVSGTATDCARGDSGVAGVTVNGLMAEGGVAASCTTSNWSATVTLAVGANSIEVIANDGNVQMNSTSASITVTRTAATDTDGDGIADDVDTDDDNDSLPDQWESLYGLDPLDAADAALDSDQDGRSNQQEYQDGTDPTIQDAPEAQQIPYPGWMLVFLGAAIPLLRAWTLRRLRTRLRS